MGDEQQAKPGRWDKKTDYWGHSLDFGDTRLIGYPSDGGIEGQWRSFPRLSE